VGSDVTLYCYARGTPPPIMHWFRWIDNPHSSERKSSLSLGIFFQEARGLFHSFLGAHFDWLQYYFYCILKELFRPHVGVDSSTIGCWIRMRMNVDSNPITRRPPEA
jgi:hypothetical protein